jgi:fructokinase
MPTSAKKKIAEPKVRHPVCVGSGFVALDLIYLGHGGEKPDFTFAGGSCGNVLTILAFLGWDSVPVIRLKDDREATQLIADLEKWQVNTQFVRQEDTGSTPVVVQRICTSINGDPYHRFEWRSPQTGLMLPRYRPLPQRIALEVSTQLPRPKVFYFDRPVPSALFLAARARKLGAVIFFEPSSASDPEAFAQAIRLADIVKYANDRIQPAQVSATRHRPMLEIQTLGEQGLRFRWQGAKDSLTWRKVPAVKVANFRDAAGAGDWCSAGIIHGLTRSGRSGFARINERKLLRSFNCGQHLAAVNCAYEGARGAMYGVTAFELTKLLARIARSPVQKNKQAHRR